MQAGSLFSSSDLMAVFGRTCDGLLIARGEFRTARKLSDPVRAVEVGRNLLEVLLEDFTEVELHDATGIGYSAFRELRESEGTPTLTAADAAREPIGMDPSRLFEKHHRYETARKRRERYRELYGDGAEEMVDGREAGRHLLKLHEKMTWNEVAKRTGSAQTTIYDIAGKAKEGVPFRCRKAMANDIMAVRVPDHMTKGKVLQGLPKPSRFRRWYTMAEATRYLSCTTGKATQRIPSMGARLMDVDGHEIWCFPQAEVRKAYVELYEHGSW